MGTFWTQDPWAQKRAHDPWALKSAHGSWALDGHLIESFVQVKIEAFCRKNFFSDSKTCPNDEQIIFFIKL